MLANCNQFSSKFYKTLEDFLIICTNVLYNIKLIENWHRFFNHDLGSILHYHSRWRLNSFCLICNCCMGTIMSIDHSFSSIHGPISLLPNFLLLMKIRERWGVWGGEERCRVETLRYLGQSQINTLSCHNQYTIMTMKAIGRYEKYIEQTII